MTLSEPRRPLDELLEHQDFLRRLAGSLVRDPAGADDLVQETWRVALEKRPRGLASPRGWLARVMRNLASERRRGQRRREAREHDWRPEARVRRPDELHENQLLRARLAAAFEGLKEDERELVELRFAEGLAPREIAARTGLPVTQVYDRLRRGVARVRADLDREYGGRDAWCVALLALCGLEPRRAAASTATFAPWLVLLVATGALLGAWRLWPADEVRAGADGRADAALAQVEREARAPDGAGRDGARADLAEPTRADARDDAVRTGAIEVAVSWEAPRERAGEVELYLERDDAFAPDDHTARAHTLRDGTARFEDLAPGKWRVSAAVGRARRFEVRAGETAAGELLLPRGRATTVRVTDALGLPAAGARVEASWPGRDDVWRALGATDARGALATPPLDARSWVRALDAAGDAGAAVSLALRGPVTLELPSQAVTLRLVVRDADGAPLAGARAARIAAPGTWTDDAGLLRAKAPPRWRTSDATGLVQLGGPAGARLVVACAGRATFARELAPDEHEVEVVLAPAATLTGVVRDATGALEPFAWVWLAGPACADGPRKLRADARGRFACDGLAAGALELTALANDPDAPGFARAEITLAEGEAFPWEPRLGPAPRLTGRVRDARGRPVANAPVRIERAARAFACDEADLLGERQGSVRVTSAADGSFGAFAFPDEAYVVCLLDADDLTRVLDWDARATAGGPPVELVAAPDRGPTTLLVGRALDADGLPARGAEVQLAGPLLLRTLRCPVDPITGDFLVPTLTAAPYRARLWRAGQAPQALADGAWIELAPGEARAFGDVVLAPPESVRD